MSGTVDSMAVPYTTDAVENLAKKLVRLEITSQCMEELQYISPSLSDSELIKAINYLLSVHSGYILLHQAIKILKTILLPRLQAILADGREPGNLFCSVILCHYKAYEICTHVIIPLTVDNPQFSSCGEAISDFLSQKLIPVMAICDPYMVKYTICDPYVNYTICDPYVNYTIKRICHSRLWDNVSLSSVPSRFQNTDKIITALINRLDSRRGKAARFAILEFETLELLEMYWLQARQNMPFFANNKNVPIFWHYL